MHRQWLAVLVVAGVGCGDDKGGAARPGPAPDAERPTEAGASEPGAGPDASGPSESLTDGAVCAPGAEETLPVTSSFHVSGQVAYPDPPPAGGNHNGCWAPWGVHEQELADEKWVHNLEHGGVVFLYRCSDGCPGEVAALREFVSGRDQALVTPYAQLPTRFGVVSWGVRMLSDCYEPEAFAAFYQAHVNRGPEQIKSGPPASCL